MPKRSSKKKPTDDVNSLAKMIVDEATTDGGSQAPAQASTGQGPAEAEKNPAAVALGRLGGLRGGRARAKKLSKARRSAIARKAAKARWRAKK